MGVAAVQRVHLNPNLNGLPGGQVLTSLTNGIAGFALVACLIALVIGAALWAIGSNANNYQQTLVGKRAFGISILAALLIGGSAAIINFFFQAGSKI